MLTKGNFTRDEWNHLLCLFNISHFSFTVCSEAMTKRVQQDSGEERVTAKSRPMMSLVARALQLCHLQRQKARGRKALKVRAPGVQKLRKMIERSDLLSTTNNLLKARTQHATQGGTMTKLGLLKSRKLMNRWMIERSNPLLPLGQGHTSPNQVSLMRKPSTLF